MTTSYTIDSPAPKKCKVIIFSGGGLRGYVIAKFMSYLDFDIREKVDAISGTSIRRNLGDDIFYRFSL